MKGWCSGVPCEGWPIQEGAQDLLAGYGLGSGSEAEMARLPWNLQKVPPWTKVRAVL